MQNPTTSPMMNNIDHEPRAVIELENAVLGAILIEKEAFERVAVVLNESDFYHESNVLLFSAIKNLHNQSKPIDLLTVIEELNRQKVLEKVGGPVYVTGITDKVASTAHLEYHALLVKQKSVERQALVEMQLAQKKIHDNEDIADVLFSLDSKIETLIESFIGKSKGNHISSALKAAIEQMHIRIGLARNNITSGIDTGLNHLNKLTNGWQNSDLIIVAARPSMGKTALMLHFAKTAAQKGIPVAIFSLEMSDVSLANRLILSESKVDPDKFKSGYLSSEEALELENSATRLLNLPIYVDDNPKVSMDYIRMKAKLLKKQGKCSMLLADYLQLASHDNLSKNANREQEVSKMSRTAKYIAKELEVPFILLSQLNRANESRLNKKPILSDLRESGAIEQDADLVAFIHRPEKYGLAPKDKFGNLEINYGEIILAKQRNGDTGLVKFKHNKGMTKFFDYATNPEFPF